jgi:hypothetical protein
MSICDNCNEYGAEYNDYFNATVCNSACGYTIHSIREQKRNEKNERNDRQTKFQEDDTYAEPDFNGVWLVYQLPKGLVLDNSNNILKTFPCVGRRARNGQIEKLEKEGFKTKNEYVNFSKEWSNISLNKAIEVTYKCCECDTDNKNKLYTKTVNILEHQLEYIDQNSKELKLNQFYENIHNNHIYDCNEYDSEDYLHLHQETIISAKIIS